MTPSDARVRAVGLLGMLIGDALGVPYEFHRADAIPSCDPFDPPPSFQRSYASVPLGTWSDDGAQALCLLASLLDKGALNLMDFSARMLRWRHEGYMAVDGHVFDFGIQTEAALVRLAEGVDPRESGPAAESDNGNGALMRVLPLALWHRGSDLELIDDTMASSLPTHGHLRSQLCCAMYCLWARGVLVGLDVEDAWRWGSETLRDLAGNRPGVEAELEVIDLDRDPGGSGSGYVVDCLHSARLALMAESYEGVIRSAIALGNDTDTTAAVAGGIAGLRFGIEGIPDHWLAGLRGRQIVDPILADLVSASASGRHLSLR